MTKRQLDTGTNELLAHVEDGVATLTMNRPERRNALSGGMLKAMAAVLAECETDPDVACVVLTGAGGAFCAGGDVKGMADGTGGGSTASAGADLNSRIHAQRLSQRAYEIHSALFAEWQSRVDRDVAGSTRLTRTLV